MNKIKKLLLLLVLLLPLSGCIKRDNMDSIIIKTTIYPIEYIANELYGYNSTISSIYPNDTTPEKYSLTDKKVKEYAQSDIFIYNGATDEKLIAAKFLESNKHIKLIDATQNKIKYNNDVQELWLYPSNYLMLAQNVKNTLIDYANSTILKQEIENNYEELKLTISTFDANLKMKAEKSSNNVIIVGNDVFKFLETYGFEVVSIEENDNYVSTDYQRAKNLITSKKNKYIYILDTDEESENVKKLKQAGATVIKINTMETLTETERTNKDDYKTLMNDFIENIKKEAYGE